MNQKVLQTLEFDKIINILTGYATTELGKLMCANLKPMTEEADILNAQDQTQDALTRIYKRGNVSFFGVSDLSPSLARLKMRGTLGTGELLDIARVLESVKNAVSYGVRMEDDLEADSLDELFESLVPLDDLLHEIRRCIISEEEISDDASSTLKHIRRAMKQTNQKIHTQLTTLVSSASNQDKLQDAIVTMRNGRYCIPVKQEYRSSFQGMIHDQSASGNTLFIEPMSVVTLNNELKELEGKEQSEIEHILSILSEQASYGVDDLAHNQKTLVLLDFIFAKAKYAKDIDASKPIFREDGIINIKQGCHPLLDRQKVVPINVSLGKDFSMLIVTGPNTGGKTVSLKTVGLLSLMGQAGLHIPAFQGSSLGIFREIFADIGDEQSIEQNLSTFSSHMTNIVSIVQQAHRDSLVLLDELCGGTDPIEGAALAISILSDLHGRGIKTMATTHYSELKMFALSTDDIENASCEFDVETLRPTYRLLIGVPGKSNAFAISQKLGLPLSIIERAKEQISQEDETFEDVLSNLEESRKTIESEREELLSYKEEIKTLKEQLEAKQDKLDQRKERIIAEANEEAHRILREAKDYADQTMRIFNKAGKDSMSAKELEKHRSDLRKKMDKAGKKVALKTPQKQKSTLRPQDLSLGDSVKVMSLNVKGTVSSKPDSKGMLFVQMGILRSKVHISDLQLIDEPVITGPALSRTGAGKIKMNKSASVRTEINLLGKTVDEAVSELDKYLDDAYLAHLSSVRIVHGKGTGALRKGVHNYLKRLKYVQDFHLAEFGEGDAGVTIVEFKK